MAAARRFPPAIRAALTGDERDVRAAEQARSVQWIQRGKRRKRPVRQRVNLNRSAIYLSRSAFGLLPAGCTKLRIGLLDDRLILMPGDANDSNAYRVRPDIGIRLGERLIAELRRLGFEIPSRWIPRWNAECGWLECEREATRK